MWLALQSLLWDCLYVLVDYVYMTPVKYGELVSSLEHLVRCPGRLNKINLVHASEHVSATKLLV